MRGSSLFLGGAVALMGGCNPVTKLEERSSERALPPPVAAVLQESCTDQAECHSGSPAAGDLAFDPAGAFIEDPRGIVVPGDPTSSRMIIRINAGEMPVPNTLTLSPEGRLILIGWIADGAPLVEGEGGSGDSGSSTGSTGGSDSSETGLDSSSSGEPDVPVYDEFLPVLEIMQANCGGPTCHRDGGIQPPGLDDAVAYDNIVGQDSFGGIPYVSPGDSAGSHIVTRITSADAPMPPASEDNPLSQADTDTIIAWIDAGANL